MQYIWYNYTWSEIDAAPRLVGILPHLIAEFRVLPAWCITSGSPASPLTYVTVVQFDQNQWIFGGIWFTGSRGQYISAYGFGTGDVGCRGFLA